VLGANALTSRLTARRSGPAEEKRAIFTIPTRENERTLDASSIYINDFRRPIGFSGWGRKNAQNRGHKPATPWANGSKAVAASLVPLAPEMLLWASDSVEPDLLRSVILRIPKEFDDPFQELNRRN
jgi:hypothetical protein